MVLIITDNKVTDRDAYLPLAQAFARDVALDKGCHEMNVCVNPDISDRVVFVSKWDSKDDFFAHVKGPSFAKHIPGMAPYYVSGTDICLDLV
jgi:quinol monooxygenase YgiN